MAEWADPMRESRRVKEYAEHCEQMARLYAHAHPRWLWYSTMAHTKTLQSVSLARRGC